MTNPVCPHCEEGPTKCECGSNKDDVISIKEAFALVVTLFKQVKKRQETLEKICEEHFHMGRPNEETFQEHKREWLQYVKGAKNE